MICCVVNMVVHKIAVDVAINFDDIGLPEDCIELQLADLIARSRICVVLSLDPRGHLPRLDMTRLFPLDLSRITSEATS